ncbi:tubulin-folding cofactor A-like isoform X1 [Papaver somniferum]|uniref:tubulin-folding cofactor A-like isoform X1 n=2 Tax=Papaver somniferum TaxID=3469 RepID=UPI000E6FCA9C|nr:tubulin-folding cofactor A-like isoform X1 [Papaver somniferum]
MDKAEGSKRRGGAHIFTTIDGLPKRFIDLSIKEVEKKGYSGASLKQVSWKRIIEALNTEFKGTLPYDLDQKALKNHVSVIMATLRNLKIKTGTCKRVLKELYSYEKEVEREASKTADMKEKGADPYDLKQQENVLAESRMMIPDCHKRLETSLADIKETLAQLEKSNQQDGPELDEARKIIDEVEILFKTSEA